MLKKTSLIKNFNKLLLSVNERKKSFFKLLLSVNKRIVIFFLLLLSVNEGIKSFFKSPKVRINSKRKIKETLINLNRKIIISLGSGVILVLSYFLIPSFYNKDLLKIRLENQIREKYNLEIKFEKPLRYGLFPKPHFYNKDTVLNYKDDNLAKADLTKIYITKNNFFSLEHLKIKNLIFKQTEFNVNSKNFDFFKKLLNSNKSSDYINFKDSKLFYKDKNKDVIFLTNINSLISLHNDEFNQELNTNLEIFNIPLKIKIVNNLKKKNAFIDIDLKNLRMNIKNNFDYSKEDINGLLEFKIISKLKKITYSIDKKSLSFNTNENNFKGKLDFKPFYLSSDLKFHQLDIGKIFKNNSIILDLINAEILNNQSLNAVVNINIDKIKNVNYLKDIDLKIYFEEGNIFIKDSTLNWKNSVLINLDKIQLISENNNTIFTGVMNFDFKDINDFYRQYQVKKIYRKKFNKIRIDFLFNLNENEIQFDNLKIDGSRNKTADNFLNNFNSKKHNIFNKIIFKNLIKEFFGNI